jgi:hypothetical protein
MQARRGRRETASDQRHRPLHRVVLTGMEDDMSDIAKELRDRSLRAEQEGEPLALLDDAADEIERLRLTDAEREAIELAIETWVCKPQLKATLRGLLERQG